MKRLAALAAILAITAVQITALADEAFVDPAWYTGNDRDDISVSAGGYNTVYITKDPDGTIVYVNQADTVYNATETFLLKSNPEIGRYKVLLGSNSGYKETYFYVGVDSNDDNDLYMKRLQNAEENEDNSWNIGYYAIVPARAFEGFNSLKVGYKVGSTPTYGGFPLHEKDYTLFEGDGDLYVIFQLNDVPEDKMDSVAVYLSSSSLQGGG